MNPEEAAFESIVEYNLEPDIYSFALLQSFDSFLQKEGLQQYPVHIEIETGMNRLGFATDEIEKLAEHLGTTTLLKVQSVFSHLAASEDPSRMNLHCNNSTYSNRLLKLIEEKLDYSFLQHIANSAGIFGCLTCNWIW